MSITNADIAAIPSYTDAELLIVYRAALVTIGVGNQSVSVQGRTYTRADLKAVQDMITWLEGRVTAADPVDGPNDGIALIKWDRS